VGVVRFISYICSLRLLLVLELGNKACVVFTNLRGAIGENRMGDGVLFFLVTVTVSACLLISLTVCVVLDSTCVHY
jgi:hypothetical protein